MDTGALRPTGAVTLQVGNASHLVLTILGLLVAIIPVLMIALARRSCTGKQSGSV